MEWWVVGLMQVVERLLLALGSTSLFQAYFEGKQDVRVAQAQKKELTEVSSLWNTTFARFGDFSRK